MRKLLLLLIFGGVAWQYYHRDQPVDITPSVSLSDWAVKLSEIAPSSKRKDAKLVCREDQYVSVNHDLSQASCRQRTQL